ncbi:hypothetical protein BH09BAC6_BH09BAC6_07580 [soil metagenome]
MNDSTVSQFHLSTLQKRVWLAGENISRYFKQCFVHVKGELDADWLRNSIGLVVSKHSILRTGYETSSEFVFPFQAVEDSNSAFDFNYIDRSTERLSVQEIQDKYTATKDWFWNVTAENYSPLIIQLIKIKPNEHVLIIALPAIAADSYSLMKLVDEIAATYYGRPFNEEDGVQYFHFSEWQNGVIETGNEEAEDFWNNYDFLTYNNTSLAFANNKKAIDAGAFDFSWKSLVLDAQLSAKVNNLAKQLDVNVSKVLLAVFVVLSKQHTRTVKFTIGVVNNNRSYEELRGVIGLLAQTLPVIIETTDGTTFTALVKNIDKEFEKVKAWEEYFTWGAKTNDYSDENSYLKLEFEYNNLKGNTIGDGETTFGITQLVSINTRFDLKLSAIEWDDKLKIDFYYNTQLLESVGIEVLMEQYKTLLTSAIDNGYSELTDLLARSDKETDIILNQFNGTDTVHIPGASVITLFENTVNANPGTIAVKYEGVELSFDKLNNQANQIAKYLISECGAGPGKPVAIWMPRSEKLIAVMLGILKTGAYYLPIDSSFPEERVKYMLTDSEAEILIATKKLRNSPAKQIVSDDFALSIEQNRVEKPGISVTPSHPVYMIYTSGSTGAPKGVRVSNSSLINYVTWFINANNLNKTSNTLLMASVAFDLSYTSLWTSLLSGHTLSIAKETEYFESQEIINRLVADEINYIKLTASQFSIILNDPDFEKNIKKYKLELIVLGGEEINIEDIERYCHLRKDVKILHHYGPTETTIGTIACLVKYDELPAFKRKIVLGKPIQNNQVYILDNNMKLAPIGFTGEIAVAGKGVSLGYLNRPELNREKFIQDPFKTAGQMYLTGDLGRWMPDGTIEFLGRKDNQLKIRGYRIELGEIESTLLKHDKISNAAVLAKKTENGESTLIAYLITHEKISNEQLNIFLTKYLPVYMVPDNFARLNAFPLTPNGKIDKNALLALALIDESQASFMPPKTILEKKMALIWKEVLGKEKIGITDDFFKLGGHSLKATQLISRIFKNLGFRIKLEDVFANPTIGSLLEVIASSGQIKYESIKPIEKKDYYDVSHAQKRLWFLDQFEEKQSAYNTYYGYWLHGELKIEALEMAFELVLKRHEILRTTFVMIDGVPKQKVNEYGDCNFRLENIDLRNEADPDVAAIGFSKQMLDHTFNLANGPIIRVALLQTHNDKYAFLLVMHHIATDNWSMRVFMNEIMTAYNANCSNLAVEAFAKPLNLQYKDYAAWHNNIISGPEEKYWFKQLANPPALVNLPYDKILPGEADDIKPYATHELDKKTTSALRELAKAYNSTLSNIVLTIYSLFINKVSGQSDFLIGVGHANRNHADLEELIGFFVNLLTIRVQLHDDSTVESVIKDVTRVCIEAYDNSNYPFDLLVEKFCNDRYSIQQPLVNILYDFKSYTEALIENESFIDDNVLQVSAMPKLRNTAKFDLTLFVVEVDDNLKYWFEYNNQCFSEQTIDNFYRVFNELLTLILESEAIEKN